MTETEQRIERVTGAVNAARLNYDGVSGLDNVIARAADAISFAAGQAQNDDLITALSGMLTEWDKFTRYGSPIAKASNAAVNYARAALAAHRLGEPT